MIIDFFLNSHYPSLSEREKSESEAKPADPTTTTAKTADKKAKTDTAKHVRSDGSKAALRSAIIPGWGQAYNKKYWKNWR